MEKYKTFEEVRNYLQAIPHIHCGGCGISAYAMYLWLKANKQLPNDFKFVFCYACYDEDNYMNNQNVMRTKNGNVAAPCHIGIVYNGKYIEYIDCCEEINISGYKYIQFANEEWFIKNAIDNVSTWNNTFDRRLVNKIEKRLKIKLKIKR